MVLPQTLVESFGTGSGETRYASYEALVEMGTEALPAIREGLKSPSWQVRRWCAICLDRVADQDASADLVPLMRDPHPKVRLWAVHSIACDHCKEDVSCDVDVVPLLVERALEDSDVRVRRMAVIMLGSDFADPRSLPALEEIVRTADDRKLRAHASRSVAAVRNEIDGASISDRSGGGEIRG